VCERECVREKERERERKTDKEYSRALDARAARISKGVRERECVCVCMRERESVLETKMSFCREI